MALHRGSYFPFLDALSSLVSGTPQPPGLPSTSFLTSPFLGLFPCSWLKFSSPSVLSPRAPSPLVQYSVPRRHPSITSNTPTSRKILTLTIIFQPRLLLGSIGKQCLPCNMSKTQVFIPSIQHWLLRTLFYFIQWHAIVKTPGIHLSYSLSNPYSPYTQSIHKSSPTGFALKSIWWPSHSLHAPFHHLL